MKGDAKPLAVFVLTMVGFTAASMAVIYITLTHSIHANTVRVNRASYDRCIDRGVNVNRQNAFYQSMAKLEATNRFIDQKLRDERVRLYEGEVLAAPNCGPKP